LEIAIVSERPGTPGRFFVATLFRGYSNGAIGTIVTGWAAGGLATVGGASAGFAVGVSGTDPVTSADSPGRDRGIGACAATFFAGGGAAGARPGTRPDGKGWASTGTSLGGTGAASE
jgi:hypothetical protein